MEKREIKSRTKGRLLVMGTAMLWGLSGVCTKSIAWGSLSIVCISSIISFFMMAISKKSIRLHVTKENLIGAAAFAQLKEQVSETVLKYAAELKKGIACAKPMASGGQLPCEYCKMKTVCRVAK